MPRPGTSAAHAALDMLGDSTRRAILEKLRGGPLPVGEIARGLPVSRPAVSQHLKLLESRGLVRAERQGTRRVFRADARGLAELRRYLDALWADALREFERDVVREPVAGSDESQTRGKP